MINNSTLSPYYMKDNLILMTDSYKMSHAAVYPEGTQHVYSYLESRGGKFSETVFIGLSYYLQKYLSVRITHEMIDYAEERITKHFGTNKFFNRAGWEYIVDELGGKIPLRIKAVPEGSVVPTRNVLMTIENTDRKCWWATNYFETLLLKVWYSITVATLSREIKKIILDALVKTGDPSSIQFKLHDFGYRGVSSEESAGIGGISHLINFMGTDNFAALEYAKEYYGEDMAGFSIPATEHSVMCARGETGEVGQMQRFLQTFADGPYPAIACVSDTYNIFRACEEYWGGQLKNQVEALHDKVLVVRPDSGDPVEVVRQVVETLDAAFGHMVNDKGYKVLNHVRVIQGDGITLETIRAILDSLIARKYSADNIAFGMGGALLQHCNRDTMKFAIKASSYVINNRQFDFRKSPITDNGKRSKSGRLKLIWKDGQYQTVDHNEFGYQDVLQLVYEDGEIFNTPSLEEIRARAEIKSDVFETIDV